jgi:hypothetical protein
MAKTANGVRYSMGFAQGSGIMDTTFGNGFRAATLMYFVFREFLPPKEAFECTSNNSAFSGDDSAIALPECIPTDRFIEQAMRICSLHGITLELECVATRSKPRFVYLGRVFLNAFSDAANCADIARQAAKLHFSTDSISHRAVIMRRKAISIMVTDPFTPILSDWAQAILRITADFETVEQSLNSGESSYFAKVALQQDLLLISPDGLPAPIYPSPAYEDMVTLVEDTLGQPAYDYVTFFKNLRNLEEFELRPLFQRVGELGTLPAVRDGILFNHKGEFVRVETLKDLKTKPVNAKQETHRLMSTSDEPTSSNSNSESVTPALKKELAKIKRPARQARETAISQPQSNVKPTNARPADRKARNRERMRKFNDKRRERATKNDKPQSARGSPRRPTGEH